MRFDELSIGNVFYHSTYGKCVKLYHEVIYCHSFLPLQNYRASAVVIKAGILVFIQDYESITKYPSEEILDQKEELVEDMGSMGAKE